MSATSCFNLFSLQLVWDIVMWWKLSSDICSTNKTMKTEHAAFDVMNKYSRYADSTTVHASNDSDIGFTIKTITSKHIICQQFNMVWYFGWTAEALLNLWTALDIKDSDCLETRLYKESVYKSSHVLSWMRALQSSNLKW